MQIAEILKNYPQFSLAKESDNEDILAFFHRHQMQTSGLQIFYDRGDDFFSHLQTQGEQIFVFIYRNPKGELKGIGSVSVREQIVNGKKQRVLYLGDLRSETSREVSQKWKELYSEMMKNINYIQEFGSPYNFTVIMHNNLRAIKALVKNQNKFDYVFLDNFQMNNVFCKIPFFYKKTSFEVHRLKAKEELKEFYNDVGIKYQLGLDYELFLKRFQAYPSLKVEDVVVVKKGTELIGSCLLWHPSPQKKIILKNLPWYLKVFNLILSLITLAPKLNQELKINYLNDLIIKDGEDKSEVIQAIMQYLHACGEFKKYHSIAFASFEKDPIVLKGFLQDKTKLLFYTVKSQGQDDILAFEKHLNFNLSWV